MKTKDEFVECMLKGSGAVRPEARPAIADSILPGPYGDHTFGEPSAVADDVDNGFARRLLEEACDFGDAQQLERAEVILGEDEAARSLPASVFYWPKTSARPHHTLLFELQQTAPQLLNDSLFRDLRSENRFHDAAHRLIQFAQKGFRKGGERRGAAVRQGQPEETLIVVSLRDSGPGEQKPVNVLHFGTVSADHGSLETFFITDEPHRWARYNRSLAEEHLARLYFRHFCKLGGDSWQDAFLRGEERKLARRLLDACGADAPDPKLLQQHVVKLVREIAKSFGRGNDAAQLVFDDLPRDHFIGASPTDSEKRGFQNPFQGITVRDDAERLLGYVIYCLDERKTAARLHAALAEYNAFHNVLVIYPDGEHTALELWQGRRHLVGKLTKAGARFQDEGEIVNLLSRFFVVSKSDITSPNELARALARRARYLRLIALQELQDERRSNKAKRPVLELYEIFDKALARQKDEEFADAYSQTLTYGALAARWMSRGSGRPFTARTVVEQLPSTSPFLKDLFRKLIELRIAHRLRWLIEDILQLLNRTSVSEVFEKDKRDPVIHFYEDFLDEYDPQIRKDRGVYYTPDEVVSYMVRTTHSALKSQFGLPMGLADTTPWASFAKAHGLSVPDGVEPHQPFVQILDPATGTGTFLLRVIQVVHETMMAEYSDRNLSLAAARTEWTSYVRKHLLPRLNGFELMMAPYIVSHLRLGLALEETGFIFEGRDRLRVFLTNTLELHSNVQLNWIGEHVAEEAREADWVKSSAPISVIIGNPPYDRHSADDQQAGGWIRRGDPAFVDGRAPLEDYTAPVVAGGGGGDLKNLYNLYVYFWRWSTWRVFESSRIPGIITLITPNSFLRGPAFRGMRGHLRSHASSLFLLDLEGDQRGARKTENVFFIMTPVVVCSTIRTPGASPPLAAAWYLRLVGSRAEKLAYCAQVPTHNAIRWQRGFAERDAALMGVSTDGVVNYGELPLLASLFPWVHTGAEFQRTWPIGETRDVLEARWQAFLLATDRASAFCENRDRKITKTYPPLFPADGDQPALDQLRRGAAVPRIERFGFRSFQRTWCFADGRIGTVLKPVLWHTLSNRQVFITSFLSGILGTGPAATVTAYVPDKHYFHGRGGKDVIPLWRDKEAKAPNIAAVFRSALERVYGRKPSPEEIFAYAYAVLANPGYVARFEEELQVPGSRLPVTKDPALFDRGVAFGGELIRWHTFGERFRQKDDGFKLSGQARILRPIPGGPDRYPERFRYDESQGIISIGDGQIGPISKEVWEFSVSGFHVLKSWLDYRMKKGAGKKSSPLDEIRPERWTDELTHEFLELLWVLEWTCLQYPVLDAWLDEVLAGTLFTAQEIPAPTEAERKEPKTEHNRQRTLLE